MATYITVQQQAGQQLLEANAKQTAVNRAGLKRSLLDREAKRLLGEGNNILLDLGKEKVIITGRRRSDLPDEELAASRRRLPTFGFLDYNGVALESSDPLFAAKYEVDLERPLNRYKVIRIIVAGANDSCAGRNTPPDPFFYGKEAELAEFVNTGGVLWINNEFYYCGINASVFNAYLADAFGATIGFVDNQQPEGQGVTVGPIPNPVIRNSLSYTAQEGIAPPYFYTAATCSITGGTPYYSSNYGPVCAFEQIGNGYLVLSGDSNGTAEYPSYTEGVNTFVQALIAL